LHTSWTHILARWVIRPLIGTGVTPNHLTSLRLITGLAACIAVAIGTPAGMAWGGVLWLVSAFLDRADGELARIGQMTSAAGHAYDYRVDLWVNSAIFLGAGVGLRHSWLGPYAPPLGLEAALGMWVCCWLSEEYEKLQPPGVRTFHGAFGFDPDDALYLIAPLIWFGWLAPTLIAAAAVSTLIALVILARLMGLKHRLRQAAARIV
jgi:archaetidylinositol phosphate synthase